MAKSQSKFQEEKDETMTPVRFYDQLPKIVLDGDICQISKESKIEARTQHYTQFKLFGRSLHDMMKMKHPFLQILFYTEKKKI